MTKLPPAPGIRRPFSLAAALVLAALLSAPVRADFPKPSGPVNDFAGILSDATETALATLSADVERDTTAEIAVVTVSSLDGMSVEEYANKLFHAWGIGQKGTDNGVLVLVAPTEHKMRIEVGYGLEGVLPDGLAGTIIREQFTPAFKNDAYDAGVRQGVNRIAQIIRRNHTLTPEERAAADKANSNEPPLWLIVPFFGVFVAIGGWTFGNGVRAKEGFFLLFGSVFAGLPFLMSLVFNRKAMYALIPIGLLTVIAGLRGKTSSVLGTTGMASRRNRTWTWGTSGGSGSSGWSSSSGGSSSSSSSSDFGGGDSGGGGASGSW